MRAREVAELWLWRAEDPKRSAVAEKIEAAAARRLVKNLDGDLPAMGKPFRDLGVKDRRFVRSIAAERAHALAWLEGDGGAWDGGPSHGPVPSTPDGPS